MARLTSQQNCPALDSSTAVISKRFLRADVSTQSHRLVTYFIDSECVLVRHVGSNEGRFKEIVALVPSPLCGGARFESQSGNRLK
jgi:hypothetical protein